MTNQQKEQLRHAVLDVLVPRFPTAHDLAAIRRRITREDLVDFTYTDDDLTAAIAYLAGAGHLASHPDPVGSTLYWGATQSAVQKRERAEL